jgi:DNA-directed RNA polymerase specialized sigma24 family protein
LPARQWQVVALRLFLDLDTDRTANVLGIAPGTVQAHLGRAIAALREDLTPNDSRRANHERQRIAHGGEGAAKQGPYDHPG